MHILKQLIFGTFLNFFLVISLQAQLATLSDEFISSCSIDEWLDLNITEGWNASHLESSDINETFPGQLTLMPYTTGWYQNRRGPLIYKMVSGNFVFTTHVSVKNRTEDGLPASTYSLAGCMMREPKTMTQPSEWNWNEEDYIFLSTGYASMNHPSCPGCPSPHFEVKTTNNSNSQLAISSVDTASVTIRLARLDSYVIVLFHHPGGTFSVQRRFYRNDFPDSVQVGLVAYTDWPKVQTYTAPFQNENVLNASLNPDPSSNPNLDFNPDVLARFEFARFDSVSIPQNLGGIDLLNEMLVPDSILLQLLGYESQPQFSGHSWTGALNEEFLNPANWDKGTVPGSDDDVYIPNCSCPEMTSPVILNDTIGVRSLFLAPGAEIEIGQNGRLDVLEN
jgi:hypothetical protein